MAEILRKTLKNGLLILAEKMPNVAGMTAVSIGVKVGSIYEEKKISGISHLIEHLAFKSQGKRNFESVIKGFEHNGFAIRAGTCPTFITYTTEGPCDDLYFAMGELYKAVRNKKHDPLEVKSEKEQIKGEILSSKDELSEYCFDKLFQAVCRGSSFEKPVMGTPQSIKKLSRQKIIQFKKNYFRPNNMIVAVCGKFDERTLFNVFKKTFGRLKRRELVLPEIKNPGPVDYSRRTILKKRKGIRSNYLCFAYLLPGFDHPDTPKLFFLHSILCNGMSSKLYLKLMQKRGLGYAFYGDIENLGEFSIFYFVVQIAKPEKILKAKRLILDEIKKLRNSPLEDIEGYKKWFVSCYKRKVLAIIYSRAESLLESEIEGWSFDFRKLSDIVSRLTAKEIQEAAQEYLTEKYTLLTVAPWGSKISGRFLKKK